MAGGGALEQVFDLARAPRLAQKLRERPLPDGMLQVLRLAAGDEETVRDVVTQTGRTAGNLRDAAVFYVIQVLLNPDSDSYRVLGARSGASRNELRSHMVWLLKWLHPDTASDSPNAIFAARVIKAWDCVKYADERQGGGATRSEPRDQGMRSTRANQSNRAPARSHLQNNVRYRPKPDIQAAKRRRKRALLGGVVAASVLALTLLLAIYGQDLVERLNGGNPDTFRPAEEQQPHVFETSDLGLHHD